MPAQLTATRSGAPVPAAASTAARTDASSATSVRANRPPVSLATRLPASSLRSATTTVAPAAASARTGASPTPPAPPETIPAVPFTSMPGASPPRPRTPEARRSAGQREAAPRRRTRGPSDGRDHQLARLVRPEPGQRVRHGLVRRRLVGEPVREGRLEVGQPGRGRGGPGEERTPAPERAP